MAQLHQQNHENVRAKQTHRAVRTINNKQAARSRHMRNLYKHSRERFLGNRSLTCAMCYIRS